MAIHIPEAPAAGLELVRDNGRLPITDGGGTALAEAVAPADALRVLNAFAAPPRTASYPVYTADSESLSSGQFLTSARLTGWHYVVGREGTVHGVAEVARIEGAAQDLSYAAYHSAASGERVLAKISEAETLPEVAAGDYELRVLRAPDVFLIAVWLHAEGDDLLLPVQAPVGVSTSGAIREDALAAVLRPLAELRLSTSDR